MSAGTTQSLTGAGTLHCRGLTRRFGEKLALAPTDLDLGPGGVIGLLGPNGSGKSTLMRCLVGLVRPDAGTAILDGVELVGDGTAIRRRVTYAPGEMHLYGEMKGGEHLDWLLRGREPGALERARTMAGDLDLPLERKVRGFSHGMKRQLLFVAAMAPATRIRILDEPTEGLDPTKRGEVLDLLAADAARGTTVLLSSHHLGEVDRSCKRLLFLNAGKLIADETPAKVHERATRLLHLGFAGEAPAALDALDGVESVRREGPRAAILLIDKDPRRFLGALAARQDLPAPTSVEHGRVSLTELYRDLYGVEGV
ncbi:MAG: ABC transporter ATP-binding protein [Planctomycetota bacterium]|nr:ABC transporter ATP-binding protein [Planctomycetota bacterium]